MLAENSGVKPKEIISKLYAAHSEGNKNMGFDIDGESGDIKVSQRVTIRNTTVLLKLPSLRTVWSPTCWI